MGKVFHGCMLAHVCMHTHAHAHTHMHTHTHTPPLIPHPQPSDFFKGDNLKFLFVLFIDILL